MKPDEEVAYRFLCREFGENRVVYEPDGNVPPDFVVQGGPAVEVRRLNRIDFSGDSPKGLEESIFPRWDSAYSFFPSLGPPQGEESWFVFLRLHSPAQRWNHILEVLRIQLEIFHSAPEKHAMEWEVVSGVRIELVASSNSLEHAFFLGSIDDGNQAYWVVSELIQSIRYCAEEKLLKVAQYRHRYREWWLVLVDHIAFGPTDEDMSQLREHLELPTGWDKVVLVGGKDAERVSEA